MWILANESVPVELVVMLLWLVICHYFYDYAAGLFQRMMYFVVDCEAIFCQQKCLVYLVFDDRNDKSKAKHRSFGDDEAHGCEC